MKIYIVKFNGIDYQVVEGVFTSHHEAVFFLEEALGMKASDNNVWIDPSKDAQPGCFRIEKGEVKEETDEVYIVKLSVECFSNSVVDVFSSRDDAVAYIEQYGDVRQESYNLWHNKESVYEYWTIEKRKIL